MKFKKGDILLSKGNSVVMRLVRLRNKIKYGNSGYSHASIIGKINKDTVTVYEALTEGFVKNEYEKWWLSARLNDKDYVLLRSKKPLKRVEKTCEKYLGRPYGFLDILSISLHFLFGLKLIELTGAKKLICSEAVIRVLYDCSNKKIDFEKEYDTPFSFIDPMQIYLSKQLKLN